MAKITDVKNRAPRGFISGHPFVIGRDDVIEQAINKVRAEVDASFILGISKCETAAHICYQLFKKNLLTVESAARVIKFLWEEEKLIERVKEFIEDQKNPNRGEFEKMSKIRNQLIQECDELGVEEDFFDEELVSAYELPHPKNIDFNFNRKVI